MKLINRYVKEVGKRLLIFKGREDIEKELRSTLEDMLEDRAQKAGRPADEAMEIELLKEYGSPQKVAQTYSSYPYNSHAYVIGPRIFPFFFMILRIVFFSIVIGLSVVTVIQLISQISAGVVFMGAEFMKTILQGVSNIISTAIAGFGYMVFAFALIERFVPDFKIDLEEEKEWDPASLAAEEPNPNSVNRGELIVEIVFTFIGLAIINGVFNFPIFSEEFLKLVPWINIVALAQIVLDIYLLRNAAWSPLSRIFKVLIGVASIAIIVLLIRTPNVFSFVTEILQNVPQSSSVDLEMLKRIVDISISGSLIIALIVQGIELAKSVFGLLRINYRTK